ncbi:hypothetical protein H072_10399 [Dactylellina haptotyla CBS 200.50]|uniref:Zn(2)-C6 fungal-type domain-containing protein n=1 Tax=Dactylellina haptotyla (strain CBS 200.50) TaxID=1284197 RepID=S8BAD8_DACHA|nr:hypothetical protein H072_10399 [Dactylellina haptotyla CBS 200.50]
MEEGESSASSGVTKKRKPTSSADSDKGLDKDTDRARKSSTTEGRPAKTQQATQESAPGKKEKDDKNSGLDPANWSETKTKAGKDRKRLPLACIACRRKKIRCSGEKPACKHCVRARTPCVYKQTARKFVPRTDYMATLDKRMKRMEERLLKYVSKDQAASLGPIARSVVKPAPAAAAAAATAAQNSNEAQQNSRKRSADRAFSDEARKKSALVPKVTESTQPLSIKRSQGDVSDEMLEEGKDKLPSRELQEHLVEVYFECVYGQTYLLLHKPSFMRRFKNGTVPPVLILSLCAVSARFSNHPSIRKDMPFLAGEEWGIEAGRIVRENFDRANLTNLTVLLLLGLHELGTCNGGKSWAYGGMASRMAIALQLHKEIDNDPLGLPSNASPLRNPISFTDREIRRRLMWACFFMDRFNSSGTSRPQFLDELDIHIQLPIKERMFITERPGLTEDVNGNVDQIYPGIRDDLKNVQANMGIAAYNVRVVTLWGRVMKYMNHGGKEKDVAQIWLPESTFARLNEQAHRLRDTLPESLTYSERNLNSHAAEKLEGQFVFLHIAIHQIFLMLHRFSIPLRPGAKPATGYPMDFLRSAVQTSFKAANTIATIFADVLDRDYGVYAPFVGYTSFAAATVHVVGSFSKNKTIVATAKRNLTICVKYLTKMARFWGVFYPLWDNLRDQYDLQSRAAQSPGSVENEIGEEPSNILQYGDWFTRFPRGVDQQNVRAGEGGRPILLGETDREDSGLENSEAADDLVRKEHNPVMRKGSDMETPDEFLKKLQEAAAISATMKKTMRKKAASTTKATPTSRSQLSHIRTNSNSKENAPGSTYPRQVNSRPANGTQARRHSSSTLEARGPSFTNPLATETEPFDSHFPRSAIETRGPFSASQTSPSSGASDISVPRHEFTLDPVQSAAPGMGGAQSVSAAAAAAVAAAAAFPMHQITFTGSEIHSQNHAPHGSPWGYQGDLPEGFMATSSRFTTGHLGEFGTPMNGFTAPHEEILAAQDNGWFLPFNFSPPGTEGLEFNFGGGGLHQMFEGVVGSGGDAESGASLSDMVQQQHQQASQGNDGPPGMGFHG